LGTRLADLADPAQAADAISSADIVIGAVPGSIGYATLEAAIAAGKPCVDISFFPEDARGLDATAKEHGTVAVVDCGVMPGLGGMLATHLASQLDSPERLSIMVGGLPVERTWPLEYRAPFSPADVIEEYCRPARLRIGGETVTRPALSDPELVDFPGVGALEAFNTDGLRSLLHTLDIPTMIEKTLRYPGHAEKMRFLRELGFFAEQPRTVNGQQVAPLAVTSQLLFDAWKLEPGMAEFTAMRVEVEGNVAGKATRHRCDLLDYTDPATGDFSMARTTGWPAILTAQALAQGNFALLQLGAGIVFPEMLALDASFMAHMFDSLSQAGVNLEFTTS
jgi:saccharopine dehydrogenase-like NADP-dependent oxidoreductase